MKKISPFQRTFYVANTMEIFERLAWYGFFTLSSLYMSSPKAQGGLGFSDQERGFLQGMIPFLLYLLPVLTGALADRYGYRRMFLLAMSIMCPAYYLLGQVHSFWAFFAAFLAVAIGAACFKPVVVGTIGRTTDDSNRGLGFGVFYTMVNVGGFLGPLVAGYVRAISWEPPLAEIQNGLLALQQGQTTPTLLAQTWAENYRQINPEYLINLDFAAIVALQMLISMYIHRWQALPILVVGTLVLAASLAQCGLAGGIALGDSLVLAAVFLFALGEMIASPKSQEYVAAIAPARKTAMFMGYYFVAMALGNLFAGLLSGWAYQYLAKELGQPGLMWALFGSIGALTALALLIFNLRLQGRQMSPAIVTA